MNWRHIKVVWQKEILDTIRDRRTLVAGIIAPILITPLITLASWAAMNTAREKVTAEPTPIAVVGADEAPELVRFLGSSGFFRLVDGDRAALRRGRIKLLLRIPPGFEREALSGRRPVVLTVEFAGREVTAEAVLAKLRLCLEPYRRLTQAARAGIEDPEILRTFELHEYNVSTGREMGGMLLSFFLPFTLAIWGIMGGMYTAIDAVAGEKERRTLETLIVTPPTRGSLAAGKALAVFTFSVLALFLALTAAYLSFNVGLPLLEGGGPSPLSLDLGSAGLIFFISLPFLAMVAGLSITVSSFGRSFKETQNYFSALTFLVMLPGMALSFFDGRLPLWFFTLPFANAIALFKAVFVGSWQWRQIALGLASNTLYCFLTLALARRLLQKEDLLFKG
ncbi:MAG: ABC transporter permease [Firmicutes bacterium]|nr:ABC transporter permease [Bacillota bacterium]